MSLYIPNIIPEYNSPMRRKTLQATNNYSFEIAFVLDNTRLLQTSSVQLFSTPCLRNHYQIHGVNIKSIVKGYTA